LSPSLTASFTFAVNTGQNDLSLSFSLASSDPTPIGSYLTLNYNIVTSNPNQKYLNNLGNAVPLFIIPDNDASSLIITFAQNYVIDNQPSTLRIAANSTQWMSAMSMNYDLTFNTAAFTNSSLLYQSISFSIADTRHGGGCGDTRVLTSSKDIDVRICAILLSNGYERSPLRTKGREFYSTHNTERMTFGIH